MNAQKRRPPICFAALYLLCVLFGPIARAQDSAAPDMPKPKISAPPKSPSDSAQPPVPPSQGDRVTNADGSKIVGSRYTNAFFGFTFDFPSGWVVHPNAVAQKMMDETKNKLAEGHPALEAAASKPDISAPLLVVSEPTAYKDSNTARTLKILASDVGGDKRPGTAVDYLNAVDAMAKEGKLPVEFLTKPAPATINGKSLGKAYLKMVFEGKTYFVASYALRRGEYMLQFMITSPERDGLAELEPQMETLRFSAKSSHP